jgi:hypothetical protein
MGSPRGSGSTYRHPVFGWLRGSSGRPLKRGSEEVGKNAARATTVDETGATLGPEQGRAAPIRRRAGGHRVEGGHRLAPPSRSSYGERRSPKFFSAPLPTCLSRWARPQPESSIRVLKGSQRALGRILVGSPAHEARRVAQEVPVPAGEGDLTDKHRSEGKPFLKAVAVPSAVSGCRSVTEALLTGERRQRARKLRSLLPRNGHGLPHVDQGPVLVVGP